MALPDYIVQKMWARAQTSETNVMLWSDFLALVEELRHETRPGFQGTPPYVLNQVGLPPLPQYNNDAQAQAGGLTSGKLYRTSAGAVRQLILP